jgi:hypothetical protein
MGMSATRTHTRDRTMNSADVGRRGSACRSASLTMTDADDVISRITRGEPMTVRELRDAFAFLSQLVPSGQQNVLVARVRVAVRLETLGA